tara:strand:+ start:2225 stop:2827 length:603 start_codon:yes stop_codon:yes gene_type:complete
MNDLLISGGWFIWPLLICSILLISIVIERFWFLQRRLVVPKGLLRQIQNLIQKETFNIEYQQEISLTSQLGDLLQHCYQYRHYPRDFVEIKAEEKAAEIQLILERNLSMLSTIASISPLLGLLGTVVGMITVFGNIDINGTANTDLLASGISEALITTAFGLIIAVPGIVFYKYFEQKTIILMSLLQATTSIFLDFLYKK